MRKITISIIFPIFLTGCSQSLGNPTASDIIKGNGDADIFQWNDGLVYSNASNTVSVQESGFTKGEELGEITRKTSNKWLFKDGAATQLPVGTKVYKANDDDTYMLIIELKDEEIVYFA